MFRVFSLFFVSIFLLFPVFSDPIDPDESSILQCPDLIFNRALHFNQSIYCIIQCKSRESRFGDAVGSNTTFQFVTESLDANSELSQRTTATKSFGAIYNESVIDDGKWIGFTYTAPEHGNEGIIRVRLSLEEIEIVGSPIVFKLEDKQSSTTGGSSGGGGGGDGKVSSTDNLENFLSFNNSTFIIILSIFIAVVITVMIALIFAYKKYSANRSIILHRAERDQAWLHSVEHLQHSNNNNNNNNNSTNHHHHNNSSIINNNLIINSNSHEYHHLSG